MSSSLVPSFKKLNHNQIGRNGESEALKEAKLELAKNLCEWGVDRTLKGVHKSFGKLIFDAVERCHNSYRGESDDSSSVTFNKNQIVLPKDPFLAAEKVLTEEIDGMKDETYSWRDSLAGNSLPPYLVFMDKYRRGKFVIKRRWEYEDLPTIELDPFERFTTAGVVKKMDMFLEDWVIKPDIDSLQGHFFEAVVASHAIHNEACHNCLSRNSLRWNGGIQSPWTDMECIFCESCYEIKSKRNMEKVEMNSDRNYFNGGSYMHYHELNKQTRKKGWKHFLVSVSRMPSYSRLSGPGSKVQYCWSVQIAEIDRIVPRLLPATFERFSRANNIKLSSSIRCKDVLKSWFKVPFIEFNFENQALQVLKKYFGQDVVLKRLSDARKNRDNIELEETRCSKICSEQENKIPADENNDDDLSLSLELVDDWEELIDG